MLKKIASACFSFLVVSGLFLAAQSDGFAQRAFDWDYTDIIEKYRKLYNGSPSSEEEYQIMSKQEGEYYRSSLEELKQIHLKRDKYYSDQKESCVGWRTKKECVEAMDLEIGKNAEEYIKAIKELNTINKERRRKLNDARSKLTLPQKLIKRTSGRRVFEDSIIFPQKKRKYQRRRN